MRASLLPTNQQSFVNMLAALPLKTIGSHSNPRQIQSERLPKAIRVPGFQTNSYRSK